MDRLTDAVEDLARALGWWLGEGAGGPKWRGADRWTVYVTAGGAFVVSKWDGPYFRDPIGRWSLSALEAYLVLRCALLGPTRERCPGCANRGGSHEWAQRCALTGVVTFRHQFNMDGTTTQVADPPSDAQEDAASMDRFLKEAGWKTARVVDESFDVRIRASRPCPNCTGPAVEEWAMATPDGWAPRAPGLDGPTLPWLGTVTERWRVAPGGFACRLAPRKPTGWVTHEHGWAERFLRATPSPCGPDDDVRIPDERPGDPEARAKLTRLADQLQLQALEGLGGDSEQHPDLGVWLALYLGQHPCEACEGEGEAVVSKHTSLQAYLDTREMLLTARTMPPGHRAVGQQDSSVHIIAPCMGCAGSGLALGAHADAMAEAGLRLAQGLEHALAPDLERAEAAE